jgi:hypothetical protein
VIRLRWVSLCAVKLQSVVQASCVAFVDLVTHRRMAATCNSSPHSICAVACARDPVPLGCVVRLPGLRSVFEVGNFEIRSLLIPYLFCFGCCAHVGFDDIAIGLILEIQIMVHALLLIVELVVQIVWSRIVGVVVFLNLLCYSRSSKEAVVCAEGRASVLPFRGGWLLRGRGASHSPLEALTCRHVSL